MKKTKTRKQAGKAAKRRKQPPKARKAPAGQAPAGKAGPIALPPGEPGNAAIFYDPDGYDTTRKKLVGRHAAGEGFLNGFASHAEVGRFYCFADTQAYFSQFKDAVEARRPGAETAWIKRGALGRLAETGCLYYPSPSIGPFAWRRRGVGDHGYSLCGVTHTTATHAIMDTLESYFTAPLTEWDAVICTSRVVRDTVAHVTDAYRAHFAERFGAVEATLPQFPIIPLGVNSARIRRSEEAREKLRRRLGIGDGEIAYLFVGRLSFYEKAHPLPMYLALEQAAQRTDKRLHLIQAGWFPNDMAERAFKEGAASLCPSVNAIFLDGREPDVRESVWSAADVFTSLSDNIQETFGLTPIEGMAAGLPVVVSDWNGYRDTVRDGIDGIRVPSIMPGPAMGLDLANRHADGFDSYGRYCGSASLFTAIDPRACAQAYLALAEDSGLRARMGAAGRERAETVYDWKHVIRQYQDLWTELSARRHAAARAPAAPPPKTLVHPGRRDPFEIFASYPTRVLELDDVVALSDGIDMEAAKLRCNLKMASFARDVLPRGEDCLAMLGHLERNGPTGARALLRQIPSERRRRAFRGLLWLHKLDLVTIAPG